MNKIPNFFIVGAPKAGTTSLYYYLDEHPQIYMSRIKETNYFSNAEISEQKLYPSEKMQVITPTDYEQQFEGVCDELAIGEASVSYLFYPSVAEKIKAFNPQARIIMVLRNPVDRAFSHYLMDKRLGFVNSSLDEIINNNEGRDPLNLFYQQYISLGCYFEQVERYLDTFGTDRVKAFLYEDVVRDIDGVIKEIYNFLGVDNSYKASTEQKHNVFLAPKGRIIGKLYALKFFRTTVKRLIGGNIQKKLEKIFFQTEKKPILETSLKAQMLDIFKDDILKTSHLLNRDLSNWLN